MAPRMEADFDWGDVQASVPTYDKGDYEVVIERVRGQAWYKKDEKGNPTSEIVKVIKLAPKMIGQIDSKGQIDGKLADKPVSDIQLYIHSEGARTMAKKQMMAITGYNQDDEQDEKKFNEMLKQSGLDLKTSVEEDEEGKLQLKIGEGYEKLLKGKHVRVNMEPEIYKQKGSDVEETRQKFNRLTGTNIAANKASAAAASARGKATAGVR
jgi:hypothetical protein